MVLLPGAANRLVGGGGRMLVISMAMAAEVLAALFVLPAYRAVMSYYPIPRLPVVRLA